MWSSQEEEILGCGTDPVRQSSSWLVSCLNEQSLEGMSPAVSATLASNEAISREDQSSIYWNSKG